MSHEDGQALPYRAIVENSLDTIALVRRDSTTSYATPSVTRVLGYSVEEFVERSVFEFIHPDDLDRCRLWCWLCTFRRRSCGSTDQIPTLSFPMLLLLAAALAPLGFLAARRVQPPRARPKEKGPPACAGGLPGNGTS